MPKIILNGIEYASGFDQGTYEKIGTSPLETQADNLSDAVNEIKQSLSDNKLGARIDISNYTTTQNLYVCPCDGFVGVDLTAAANAKCFVRIFGSDSVSNQISIGGWGNGTYGCYTCFVRKGMRLMTALVENNGKPFFIPITR